MDLEILKILVDNGFSIFVASYLLLFSEPRWRKTIDANTKAINEIKEVLYRCRK